MQLVANMHACIDELAKEGSKVGNIENEWETEPVVT